MATSKALEAKLDLLEWEKQLEQARDALEKCECPDLEFEGTTQGISYGSACILTELTDVSELPVPGGSTICRDPSRDIINGFSAEDWERRHKEEFESRRSDILQGFRDCWADEKLRLPDQEKQFEVQKLYVDRISALASTICCPYRFSLTREMNETIFPVPTVIPAPD